jgi:hypothetical protein
MRIAAAIKPMIIVAVTSKSKKLGVKKLNGSALPSATGKQKIPA